MTENTPQNFVIEFWVREATHIFLALFCVKMGVLTSQKCRGKRPELNVDMLTDAGVFGAEISWNFLFSFTGKTYKHLRKHILTIKKVCLFMSYDTMDYICFVIWYWEGNNGVYVKCKKTSIL